MNARSLLVGCAIVAIAPPAWGATWINMRTTPRLNELVGIDKTGEASWIYGQEDVFGDGAMFGQQEQTLDLRTTYATTDMTRFWVRVYVSDANSVGGNVTVFVFIDSDKNPLTGGRTNSMVLSPAFTADFSPGGYEFVIGLRGNGMVSNVWEWRAMQSQYMVVNTMPMATMGESGQDVDPIGIGGSQHGYVQGAVTLGVVGLTPPCNANLYVRSANQMGASDLDMSFATSCVPADANGDKIPDILVPPGCTTDAQCPQGGVCRNGTCVLAPPCVTDANCPNGYVCSADGRCVQRGGNACTSNTQCNGLVCVSGTCGPCTPGGTQCGPGARCAPDGTCVQGGGGTAVNGQVEGGAFNCGIGNRSGEGVALVIVGSLILLVRRRRRSP